MRKVKNQSAIYLFAGLISMALVFPFSAAAETTQADVDYSTKISALGQEFSKVTAAWGTAISNPPKLAFGSKWSKYKTAATKSTNAMLETISKMTALTPSEGFTKSGAQLKKATVAMKSAFTAFNKALVKNDKKGLEKADTLITKALNIYAAWSEAYAADAAALNG